MRSSFSTDASCSVLSGDTNTPDEYIIVNTAEGRQKPLNLARDPRVALSIADAASVSSSIIGISRSNICFYIPFASKHIIFNDRRQSVEVVILISGRYR